MGVARRVLRVLGRAALLAVRLFVKVSILWLRCVVMIVRLCWG